MGQDSTRIYVSAKVVDVRLPGNSYSVMAVNKTTGLGVFGDPDGSFTIQCDKNDSIYISARGYHMVKLSFRDSVYKSNYTITIPLKKLEFNIRPVEIIPERDLQDIKKDIDALGYNDKDYRVSGYDVLSSPITFLYQSFSKKEQKKRLAIELENEYRRRQLLKELFAKYVKYEIIDLEEEKFDSFIDFCSVSDERLKHMSQYDFIMYIKEKYRLFEIVMGDDYYYDR